MKKRSFAFVCFAIGGFAAFSQSAQQSRLDSLRKSLANLNDTARVNCLNQLASLHWSMSHVSRKDSMYHYARLANQQAVKTGYEHGQAISLILLAKYELFAAGNTAGANNYIDQSVRIGERIENNSILGMANLLSCDLPAESRGGMSYFDCLKKSQNYFQKAGDREGELEATTWLCMLFADEGKYEEGFAYCDKCLHLSKSITPQHSNWHHELVQWSFLIMAALYETVGDYETSMRYIQQCDQYARTNDLIWHMDILKSKMFRKMGKYDSALFYWNEWEKGWDWQWPIWHLETICSLRFILPKNNMMRPLNYWNHL
jgi:tetratricopeptide (TPR) repeat protein